MGQIVWWDYGRGLNFCFKSQGCRWAGLVYLQSSCNYSFRKVYIWVSHGWNRAIYTNSVLRELCVVLFGQICVRFRKVVVFVPHVFVPHLRYFGWYSCMTGKSLPLLAAHGLKAILGLYHKTR